MLPAMERLYFLRVDGTVFFGHEMTYMLLARDALQVISFLILLSKIIQDGNAKGISLKTQIIYIIAFCVRLTEYFPFTHVGYEVTSTFLFISLPALILFMATWILNSTFKSANDSFWLNPLVYLTNLMALVFNYNHLTMTIPIIFYAWSHYLEGVAILPQLWMIKNVSLSHRDKYIYGFLNAQAICRLLDILHWLFIYLDVDAWDHLAIFSDVFHLLVYCIFLGYINNKIKNVTGKTCELPENVKENCMKLFGDHNKPKFILCDKRYKAAQKRTLRDYQT